MLLLLACKAAVLAVIIIQNLGTLIFVDCMKIFWHRLKQEAHKGQIREGMVLYRKLQVLGIINNHVQGAMTTLVLVGATIGFSFCLAAAIIAAKVAIKGYQVVVLYILYVVRYICRVRRYVQHTWKVQRCHIPKRQGATL